MKKIICAVLCLMMLATFISAACASSDKFSYTLQSASYKLRAGAKPGYYVRLSNVVLKATFRRADHLSNGGTTYIKKTSPKTSGWSAKSGNGPWISASVSADNSADDFVSAYVDFCYEYTR